MAFDAGMLACALSEIKHRCLGGRVEKVFQPERDEILLQIRSTDGGKKILINAGFNNQRICFTGEQKENPAVPPMLCMLLRKHLQGGVLSDVRQLNFDRIAVLEFDTRDEMGFDCKKLLIAELMGKYSNLIFAEGDGRILSALRTIDLTAGDHQILPGMKYAPPALPSKYNPLTVTEEEFLACYDSSDPFLPAEKWIFDHFFGISKPIARELSFRGAKSQDALLRDCSPAGLSSAFFAFWNDLREEKFSPTLILQNGAQVEYSFCDLSHYGKDFAHRQFESAGELLDDFFRTRDREQHVKQRSQDLFRILKNADVRIRKKLEIFRAGLADCAQGDTYKNAADLITANLYRLEKGMTRVELTDYSVVKEDGSYGTSVITLDSRLSPAANAQKYYKKYAKCKNGKEELTKQIAQSEEELAYLETVAVALSHAETTADLSEIREELYRSGYASRMKNYVSPRKSPAPILAEFFTSGGYRVLCGKNNTQNEYLTHKLANKTDYWFHAKGIPGSHTVLFTGGEEPSETDFTEAAEIAAYYSSAKGAERTEVDYTLAKNVKKPPSAKPGLVIYHTNWSCIVSPTEDRILRMRKK